MLSLIPISDANPTRRFPIITVLLIGLNVVAFFTTPGLGRTEASNRYFFERAPLACQLQDECPPGLNFIDERGLPESVPIPDRDPGSFLFSIIFSTFLHAGWLHIAGNMLFLWVFGNNVEDFLGRIKFVAFYLLGGIAASLAHVMWTLSTSGSTCTQADASACIPSVGASGAVAAIMGAYLLLYPRARVNVLVPIFIIFTIIQMSALAVLLIWFGYQFLIAWQASEGVTQVAWMAHVGGFVFGLVAIFLLGGRPHRPQPVYQEQWRY
jgi:membrane associated rhomboid family serine protease